MGHGCARCRWWRKAYCDVVMSFVTDESASSVQMAAAVKMVEESEQTSLRWGHGTVACAGRIVHHVDPCSVQ